MIYGEISNIYGDIVLSIINNGKSAAKLPFNNTKLMEESSTTIAKASRVASDWRLEKVNM